MDRDQQRIDKLKLKRKIADTIVWAFFVVGVLIMLGVLALIFALSWVAGLIILGVAALFGLLAWAVQNSTPSI